jgi:hypothetical protein
MKRAGSSRTHSLQSRSQPKRGFERFFGQINTNLLSNVERPFASGLEIFQNLWAILVDRTLLCRCNCAGC